MESGIEERVGTGLGELWDSKTCLYHLESGSVVPGIYLLDKIVF